MLNYTFDELAKLESVDSVCSEEEISPVHDAHLTIFLKNGYRVISRKCALGQTMELAYLDECEIFNTQLFAAIIQKNAYSFKKPEDEIFEIVNESKQTISLADFIEKATAIVGNEVKDFLALRHDSSLFPFQEERKAARFRIV